MKALITGVTGMDGALLAEFLLDKGYEVHGVRRRSSSFNTGRIDHLIDRITLHYGDMTDATNLVRICQQVEPDEIYNLAAQSHVAVSFETAEYTAQADALGPLRLLEAIRLLGLKSRFYQASTSEMFGNAPGPQNEETPFNPRSPYAAAKVYGYHLTRMYREAYGVHASNGISFNHTGPTRGETFVCRKITRAVAAIKHGRQQTIRLGNLDAMRDWGHAKDYVRGMWRAVQQDQPGDYVFATGKARSVRAFADTAFRAAGMCLLDHHLQDDPRLRRPLEVDCLVGDATRARTVLGWRPEVSFDELVGEMVRCDLEMEYGAG